MGRYITLHPQHWPRRTVGGTQGQSVEVTRRGRGRPWVQPSPPCPDPEHAGSTVASYGRRKTAAGVVRRYRCRYDGGQHFFTVLVTTNGPAAPAWQPPPPCPEHPGGHVIRFGTYGTRTVKRRQRYRCTPPDGGKPHVFTPPLARDHVHAGHEQCDECDERRGVHHGETTVARRHSWPGRLVARGLADLAAGRSYGDTRCGRCDRWAANRRWHLRPQPSHLPALMVTGSRSSRRRR